MYGTCNIQTTIHTLIVFFSSKMASKLAVSDNCRISDVKVFTKTVLGTGSYGVVHVAVYHGTKVAAKKLHGIFFEGVSPAEYKGILLSWQQELELMSSLRHPNIVQFYGVYNSRNSSSLELSGDSYIISELMAKSLQARNLEQPRLTFRNIVDIVMDIASGLCYLHSRNPPIMHRDLASKNILLSKSGQAKIADLGVAKITLDAQASHTRHPGTDLYMPVETVMDNDEYDHSIDVYGLGVIILELAIGRDPIATQCLKRVSNFIEVVPETERRQKDFDELDQSCNKELQGVILSCLKDKENRTTAQDVVRDLEEIQSCNSYQACCKTPIFVILPTPCKDTSKLGADIKASKDTENSKLTAKLDHLQKEFQQVSNKSTELEDKLKTKEKEIEKLKHQLDANKNYYEAKLNELLNNQKDESVSNPDSFLHSTHYSSKGQQFNNSTNGLPAHVTGHISERANHSLQLNDQRLKSQRHHSASTENHYTQLSDKSLMYQRSHNAYGESYAVPTIPPNNKFSPTLRRPMFEESTERHSSPFTNNYSSLPTTYPVTNSIESPLISHPNTNGHRYLNDQSLRYQHHYETDRSGVTHQFHNTTSPQMVTSNNVITARHNTSAPQLTVREADEYLSYQVSCMDRVISQLMNPNNSDNLQSSFVQTLKEQIIKTDNYIRNLPFLPRNVGNPMMHIECQLDKLLTSNIRVTHGDRRALDEVIYRLQNTIGN